MHLGIGAGQQRPHLAHIRGRADERERDEIDTDLERVLEVAAVLLGERRDRDGDAGKVHALGRADYAGHDHGAAGAPMLDLLHLQMNVPVVDQQVVPRLQYLADDGGQNRDLAVTRRGRERDHDLLVAGEPDRLGKASHADLRTLQIGDQRERPSELLLRGPDVARSLRVLLVRAVGEVEPRGVHPGPREGDHLLG